MSDKNLNFILSNGVIAAIYFILTILNPFSFGLIQLRISEILVLLCFFRKDFVFGVTLGCMISNVASKMGLWDVLIGGGSTLVAALLVAFASPRLLLGCFYVVLVNAFGVGFELCFFLEFPFWYSVCAIAISEVAAMMVGYIVLHLVGKRKNFLKSIQANEHLDWKW